MMFFLQSRGSNYFYFDPQDFAFYEEEYLGQRKLPIKKPSTFEPLLKNYIDVTKLLITVAAASVAFGSQNSKIVVAKIFLAFSILYGVLFCALLQFYYDLYTQDVSAYKPWRYALIQSLGFSALSCFIIGYFVWAFHLSG